MSEDAKTDAAEKDEPAVVGEGTAVPESAAAPEPAPAVEPTSEPEISRVRQWVTLRGSSMDARTGWGLTENVAKDLRSAVGKPHGCLFVFEAGTPTDLVERLARDLSAQGFALRQSELAAPERSLAGVEAFCGALTEHVITADDLVVACGHTSLLAVASFACARWCGGVSLAEAPLSLPSAIVAGTTPPALDVAGTPGMLEQDAAVRFSLMDVALYGFDPTSEDARLSFALMAATAMCDSDKAFGRLWDQVDALMAADPSTLVTQLADTVKSRGKVVSSTALSTRQSIAYGQTFATALGTLTGDSVPTSTLLADGLRFSARLSVAQEIFSIDDMLTQDELLERLGLGTCEVSVDPDALVDALKAERFRRSNRLMLPIPRAIGRVRLASVEDDLLREHVAAWCAAR